MNNEIKNCQSCKQSFEITSDDFDFYKKVDVPPPTFCPQCRVQRRMSFLNERTFYRRKCDKTGEMVVSLFPQEAEVPVYSPKAWWSDDWDAIDYGQDYDFSRPFFQQFGELLRKVPQFSLQSQYTTLIRSEYTNMGTYNKDCYLVFNTANCEECSFTTFTRHGKNSLDLYASSKCELCYECKSVGTCYRARYCEDCEDSTDIYFSRDLYGCQNCFGCVNLRNKSYYIFNVPYTKEEYFDEIKKYNLGSHTVVEELKKKVAELHKDAPRRFFHGVHNTNVSGDDMFDSKNTHDSFYMIGVEDCRYCQFVFYTPARDCYDMTFWGGGAQRIYECMGAGDQEDMVKFCFDAWAPGINIEYSYHIVSPNKNIFGCVGLKNKEYCILNKQYTKEEYEALVPKIKQHMMDMPYVDKLGRIYRYGEFFPSELSLFAYSESLANSYFPLSKEEAERDGFKWKEIEKNTHTITIKAVDLPDDIRFVDDSILKEIIECEVSKRAFRLTPAEFQFYKAMNIPLPRLHPDERHKRRLAKQNPMRLWKRNCTSCNKEIETSYSPERPEKVYCAECYQKEIL